MMIIANVVSDARQKGWSMAKNPKPKKRFFLKVLNDEDSAIFCSVGDSALKHYRDCGEESECLVMEIIGHQLNVGAIIELSCTVIEDGLSEHDLVNREVLMRTEAGRQRIDAALQETNHG